MNPKDRYDSAMQMRNDIDKLRYDYNWNRVSNDTWIGQKYNGNDVKEIRVVQEKKKIEFVVKKNGRRSNIEGRSFDSKLDADLYMYGYIAKTTLL